MSLIDVLKEIFGEAFPSKQKKQGKQPMLNGLKELFKKEVSLVQTCKLSAMVINLLNEFNAETLKDGNMRDAAIDCVIQILQQEKSQPKTGA